MSNENNNPFVKLGVHGEASVISYDVPEPTMYTGVNMIEFEFDNSVFKEKFLKLDNDDDNSDIDLDEVINEAVKTGFVPVEHRKRVCISRRVRGHKLKRN